MSGFFFCGMIDDPVAQASSSRAQPNSVDVQSTTSSPSRERCTPSRAAAKQNSAAKSRSLTASIELSAARSKPSSAATASGSRLQRRAGQRAGAQRADRRPLVPVLQPVDVAGDRVGVGQQLVGDEHRLGVLQVRHAGRGDVLVPLGEAEQRVLQRRQLRRPAHGRGAAGRAAGRWRPGRCGCGPARSLPPSGAELLEQAALERLVHVLVGLDRRERAATTSADSSVSAPTICSSSSAVSSPARCSTRACARDDARSNGASRQSTSVDLDSAAIAGEGPPPKRPPHSRVWDAAPPVTQCRRAAAARGPRPASTACPTAGRSPWPGPGRRCRRCRRWRG